MAGDQRRFKIAMMHGDRFLEEGRWKDAMTAYRFALAEFSNNTAAIMGFGKAAVSSKHTDLAFKAFRQVLKINPANIEALNHMGDVYERMGQLDAAAETYFRVGNVYASQNELDAAIDYWSRATKLTRGLTNAHQNLAEALVQQGKIRPAVREYLTLAAIYQRRGEAAQMNQCLETASNLLPNDTGVLAAIEAAEMDDPIQPNKVTDAPPQSEVQPQQAAPAPTREDDPYNLDELFGLDEEGEQKFGPSGGLVEAAHQRAMEELANLIFEDSDDPNVMVVMQAIDHQSREEMAEAVNLYRQAVTNGMEHPALYFNLGLLYQEQGRLSDAIEMLERAASLGEAYRISASFALAESYFASNGYTLAIRYFVEALAAVDLKTVSGHRSYELAQVYDGYAESFLAQSSIEQIKQFVSSLQNFFANSEWERKVYEARVRMNSLSTNGDQTMSLAEFLETPETEVMVTTLATTTEYIRQNFLQTASEECLRAIQRVPTFLPLHARLAEIMLKQDRADDAITKYLYIAKVYQMRNQVDQSVNIFQKILDLAPMDVTVRSKLIDLYISQNQIHEALEEYLVLADSYYQLAQVDRALEKYNEAIRLASSVRDADKWKANALTQIADIYNQRFDWSHAATALEQLRKLKPNDHRILRQLVELYYKQSKTTEAVTALDELIAIYQRQDPRAALEFLKELVSTFPQDLTLRQRLAVAYMQNNMKAAAIKEYDSLGEMQLEMGLRSQAIQTIQAIINLGPDDVEGYRRLLAQIGGGPM